MKPTFAQIDALRAQREAKKRELIERLTRILVKEFDADEPKFAWYCEADAIRIEAYEIAREELLRR